MALPSRLHLRYKSMGKQTTSFVWWRTINGNCLPERFVVEISPYFRKRDRGKSDAWVFFKQHKLFLERESIKQIIWT